MYLKGLPYFDKEPDGAEAGAALDVGDITGDGLVVIDKGDLSDAEEPDKSGGGAEEDKPTDIDEGSPGGDDEPSEAFLKSVEGKTADELKKMLFAKEKGFGKQANELGKLRKLAEQNNERTSEKAEKDMQAVDKKIANIDSELEGLDEVDDADKIKKLTNDKKKLQSQKENFEKEAKNLSTKELVKQVYAEEHNEEFLSTKREALKKELGLEFEDEDWQTIQDVALRIADGNKLTEEDLTSALVKTHGTAAYNKMIQMKAKDETRQEITDAGKKEIKPIGKSQVNFAKDGLAAVDFMSLSAAAQKKVLDKMPYGPKKAALYELQRKGKSN